MSIFHDKTLKSVAEAAAKIMGEQLKGNQHKIDANKNGKIDAHDFKLLRAGKKPDMKKEEVEQLDEVGDTKAGRKALHSYVNKAITNAVQNPDKRTKGVRKATSRLYKDNYYGKKTNEEVVSEGDTYDKDRYAVQNGKATKDNPSHMGSANYKDQPHHVWATSSDEALKKKMNKEGIELDEGTYKRDVERAFPASGVKTGASAPKGTSTMPKDKEKAKGQPAGKMREDVEQLQEYESKNGVYKHKAKLEKGVQYGETDWDKEEKEAKKMSSPKRAQKGYGPRQNYKRSTRVNESLSFTEMLELYNEHGLKVLAPIETEEMDIDGTTIEVIDADKVNGFVETSIEEEATEEEFNKELKDQQNSFAGKKKQPPVVAGKTTGVKTMPEEVELDERHMTSGEMEKREKIVKSMKKGLSGFKQRYGERAKNVMYATATKQAMKKD